MFRVNYTSNTSHHLSWRPDTHARAHTDTIKKNDVRAYEPVNANKDYICIYDYKNINHASF